MALTTPAREGPVITTTTPAGQGQAQNEYAVQAMLGKAIRANYRMRARISKYVDRQFQNQYQGGMEKHGDAITVRRLQSYDPQTGLQTWNPQPMQQELITLHVKEPVGIQTQEQWDTEGAFGSQEYDAASRVAETERLAYKIDNDCSEAFALGYMGGVTPQSYTDTAGTITGRKLNAAGKNNELPNGAYPDNHLLTWVKSELTDRGVVEDRRLTAILDPRTSESLGRTALFTQQYKAGAAGEAAQRSGSLGGQMVGGWNIEDSETALNGKVEFGALTGEVTVRVAPANGSTTLELAGTTGNVLKKGTKIAAAGSNSVHARTRIGLGTLAQYSLQADVTFASGRATATVFPPIRFGAAGTADGRRRNTTAQPAAGSKVHLNGLDTSVADNRTLINAKSTTRSWLIGDDTTLLIYSMPDIATEGGVNVQKHTYPVAKVEFCVAVDSELKGGGHTYFQVWSRYGLGTVEYECGYQVGGEEVAGA